MSKNWGTKMVRGHRKQCKGGGEGLIGLLDAAPSARLATDLQEELESYIDKTNDISAGLQYLMLHKKRPRNRQIRERNGGNGG